MVIIYSEQITERLSYTLDLVFKTILKTDYKLVTDKNEFIHSDFPKINYSNKKIGTGLFLEASTLLFENDISIQQITTLEYEGRTCFFPTSPDSVLPFDVFACSFYVATRYEEYLFKGETLHKRFPATESILHKLNLLEEPVVNHWVSMLTMKISEQFPGFLVPENEFRFLMTIDVDNAWAYQHKAVWLQFGAMIKSILKADFSGIKKRFRVLSGKEKDPYDSYGLVEETFCGIEDHLKFFFLLGNRRRYDKNISHRNRHLQALIKKLSKKYEVGIHPSYASGENYRLVKEEKKRLEKISGIAVNSSRQHFLLLNLPQTYETLIDSGITNDFTMGYPDAIGLRAGLCTPFPFFNLSKNKTTDLTVYPLHVMDVTLKNYLEKSPEQALVKTKELMNKVKKYGGTFVCLWHNESITNQGNWKNWQDVFLQTIQTGIKLENAASEN